MFGSQQWSKDGVGRKSHSPEVGSLKPASQVQNFKFQVFNLQNAITVMILNQLYILYLQVIDLLLFKSYVLALKF